MAIVLSGILGQTPRPAPRRQEDNLLEWLKGSATFDSARSTLTGGPTIHTGYYYTEGNRTHPVELYEYEGQIHWYKLTYNRTWSHYEVDEEDQYDIDNLHLGYYPITDP